MYEVTEIYLAVDKSGFIHSTATLVENVNYFILKNSDLDLHVVKMVPAIEVDSLKNTVRCMSKLIDEQTIEVRALKSVDIAPDGDRVATLNEVIDNYCIKILNKNNGQKNLTAKQLGIDRKTLFRRLANIRDNIGKPTKSLNSTEGVEWATKTN